MVSKEGLKLPSGVIGDSWQKLSLRFQRSCSSSAP